MKHDEVNIDIRGPAILQVSESVFRLFSPFSQCGDQETSDARSPEVLGYSATDVRTQIQDGNQPLKEHEGRETLGQY